MANIDEHGRNGYSQLASKAIIKGNQTKVKKGLILDPSVRDEFYRYKQTVQYLTERLRRQLTKGYVTGLTGETDAYHIDHIFSIADGYKHKVSPTVIGHVANMRMIPWEENIQKHAKSDISLSKLFTLTEYTEERSSAEFAKVIEIIQNDIQNNRASAGAAILEELYESAIYKK